MKLAEYSFGSRKAQAAFAIVAVLVTTLIGAILLRNVLSSVRADYVAYGELHSTLRASSALHSSLDLLQITLAGSKLDGGIDTGMVQRQYAAAFKAYSALRKSSIAKTALSENSALITQMVALDNLMRSMEPTTARLADPLWVENTLASLQHQSGQVSYLLDRIGLSANKQWENQFPDMSRALRTLVILCAALGITLVLAGCVFGYIFVRLHRRLAEADASLSESRKATEQANKAIDAKNNFLAVIGHELRTPQQTLQASMQYLELRLMGRMDAVDKEAWARLKASTRQTESLMRDLTDFARLESGKMPLVNTAFNPADVLKRLVNNFQHAARKRNLHIVGDFKNTRTSILADETRFSQIASNLIVNAIKYSESGTIIVKLYYLPGDRTIMRLSVEDNGPGIREEFRAHLFEPFSQDDQSRTRKHDGAGMGLAIVERLVKLMGGRIKVANKPDGGARFTVKIPVDLAASDVGHAAADPGIDVIPTTISGLQADTRTRIASSETSGRTEVRDNMQGSGKRILLVDDKEDVRASIKALLQHFGYQIELAENGEQALQLAVKIKFDAIILDIQMPGMDGFEVAERIKNTPGPNFDVPLIAVSGFEESIAKASQVDVFTEYLMKPIGHETLIPLLQQLT